MKVLIGARCVFDHNKVKENEALEVCTPTIMAVDCSRDLGSGNIEEALANAMRILADCRGNGDVLMAKTDCSEEWRTLTGDGLEPGIKNLAKNIAGMRDGELYITLPGSCHVEIYKVEEV